MHHESHILHRQLRGNYPVAMSAQGCWITDSAGNNYLDASGGAAVSCLGHGHPDVLAAMHAQIDRIAYAHTSFFSTEVAEQLADTLIASAPGGTSHAYLVSGGSEAMEAALKLARQYFVEKGEPQRARFIARRNSYHGNTLGALAVGGNQWRRRQFAPLLIDVEHVSPTYAYRDQRDDESAEQYGERLAQELQHTVDRIGGENVIAFVAETVGGATSGALTPPPGYFKRVREICDRHGMLLILDEVMCGMGRTGTLHACEQEGIAPDLMAIAKGLGGGYQPVGAVLISAQSDRRDWCGLRIFSARTHLYRPSGRVRRRACCATGSRTRQIGRALRAAGRSAGRAAERSISRTSTCRRRPRTRTVSGDRAGADRASKQPFEPALKVHAKVKKAAMDAGLLCYPMGGTIDGARGDHVLLAPPFIICDDELDLLIGRLTEAVDTAVQSTGR